MPTNLFFQPDEVEQEDKDRYIREMGVAEPGKNWGFCSDECEELDKPLSYSVKFTGIGLISYLPEKKCQELLGVNFYLNLIYQSLLRGFKQFSSYFVLVEKSDE